VPSSIHYLRDAKAEESCDVSIDARKGSTWGYTVRPETEPLEWFKLLLLREQDLPPQVRAYGYLKTMRRRLKEQGLTAVDVTGDYLRRLWDHCQGQIASEIGGEEVLASTSLKVVMAIPAIWPSYAKDLMREAADAAGITNLRIPGETEVTFISEPEAAALSMITDLRDNQGISVR
jgi:molecular chaperone DnaK (HSP70)